MHYIAATKKYKKSISPRCLEKATNFSMRFLLRAAYETDLHACHRSKPMAPMSLYLYKESSAEYSGLSISGCTQAPLYAGFVICFGFHSPCQICKRNVLKNHLNMTITRITNTEKLQETLKIMWSPSSLKNFYKMKGLRLLESTLARDIDNKLVVKL